MGEYKGQTCLPEEQSIVLIHISFTKPYICPSPEREKNGHLEMFCPTWNSNARTSEIKGQKDHTSHFKCYVALFNEVFTTTMLSFTLHLIRSVRFMYPWATSQDNVGW